MVLWTLIIIAMQLGGGIAATSVPNINGREACENAAKAALRVKEVKLAWCVPTVKQ